MADYNSKYSGEQVEALLDQVASGNAGGGGGIAVETDPVFSASPAATITENDKTTWSSKQDAIDDLATIRDGANKGASALSMAEDINDLVSGIDGDVSKLYENKVDKVDGKQLSTEDFTTALKSKLEELSNYDDTELSNALSTLRGDFDKLVRGDTTTAIKTFNEVIAFLDGIKDSQDLSSIIASIEQQIAGKMDEVTLATVATSGSYNDLSNKPTIPPEQVNADWNATSGKAQILNKPTIPSAVTESTISGWGFTKNTGTYSKPSGGIPKSDLAEEVQASLRNAEAYKGTVTNIVINGETKSPNDGIVDLGDIPTSIPSEVYIADFTRDSLINGMNNGTNVECDVRALVDAMNANKIILVREAEDSSYKGVYVLNGYAEDLLYFSIVDSYGNILWCEGTDYIYSQFIDAQSLHERNWGSKQDTLVSGENIKTINGESIVGSGDITISGGSGEQGPQGEKGEKGDTGETGPQGPQGEQGIQGVQGIQGPKGDTGATGAQGPKGDKGDKGDTGPAGANGTNGTNGKDGVSVSSVKQTTTSSADGGSNVMTVTLSNGTTSTFTVKNGSKGSNGTNGKDGTDGEDGATFTPSVDSDGNLSWTNNKGLTNPPTVNIKGPKGDKGDAGEGGGSGGGDVVNTPKYIQWDEDHASFSGADAMFPNVKYVCTQPLSSIDFVEMLWPIDSWHGGVTDLYNEFSIIFESNETTIETPSYFIWANGVMPTIENGVRYELSIALMYINNNYVAHAVLTPFKTI